MNNWKKERHAPEPGTYLCRKNEIAPGQVKEFSFGHNSPFSFRMFVYNDAGKLRAFRNACPHYNVPLNHIPGDVFTSDRKHYLCMTHFAKFDISSGLCTEGPCEGESLDTMFLQVDGDRLLIADSGPGAV